MNTERLLGLFERIGDAADAVSRLRQFILNLAVRGKLVPQDPNDEPASELLKRIASKKAQLGKSSSAINLSVASATCLPIGWCTARLEEVSEVGTELTPAKSQPEYYVGGDIPWVNSGATARNMINEAEHFITQRAVKECRLKIYNPGSLIIALYGQGKTRGQVAELRLHATVNQACAVVQWIPSFQEIKNFVRLALEQQYDAIRQLAEGGPQPNLNVRKIRERIVLFPPSPSNIALWPRSMS